MLGQSLSLWSSGQGPMWCLWQNSPDLSLWRVQRQRRECCETLRVSVAVTCDASPWALCGLALHLLRWSGNPGWRWWTESWYRPAAAGGMGWDDVCGRGYGCCILYLTSGGRGLASEIGVTRRRCTGRSCLPFNVMQASFLIGTAPMVAVADRVRPDQGKTYEEELDGGAHPYSPLSTTRSKICTVTGRPSSSGEHL